MASGSDLVIALTRFGEESAPETRVEIPTAPAVTAPTAGASFTAGADFEVAWEPFAGGSVETRFALTACADLLVGGVTTDVTLDPAFAGPRGTSRIVREAEPIGLVFGP